MSKKTRKEKTVEEVAKKLTGILNRSPIGLEDSDVLRKTGAGQIQVDAILWILNNTDEGPLLESSVQRSNALKLLRMIAGRAPDLDFSKVIPKVVEIAKGGYFIERPSAALALRDLSAAIPGYDFSAAVPVLIANLEEEAASQGAAVAIGNIYRAHPEYDFGPALPVLIRNLEENERDCISGFASLARALEAFEPRSHADLLVVRKAAMSMEREVPADLPDFVDKEEWKANARSALKQLSRLYSNWSEKLKKRADALVSEKRFPLPKVEKPDKTERILRVKRMG